MGGPGRSSNGACRAELWPSWSKIGPKNWVLDSKNLAVRRFGATGVARQQAVQEAAQESGVSRAEVATYMDQMRRQSSEALGEVQRSLQETSLAQQRTMEEQAVSFARQLAQETQRADRRDSWMQEAMRSLREAPQAAPSITPPPSVPQQLVNN